MRASELLSTLRGGGADEVLTLLYPCPRDARERMEKLCGGFLARFGDLEGAGLFSAPGRTELGGNHTDHQGGCVLAAAVEQDIAAVAAPLPETQVRFYSEGFGETDIDLADTDPVPEEQGGPAALIRGVADGFLSGGRWAGGFAAAADSRVEAGSGLSSSAAFEVLTGCIFNGLYCGGEVGDMELACMGQRAETRYFGKPSGLMDQAACALGGVLAMDFADPDAPAVERVNYSFAGCGHALIIIASGAGHAGLTEDYALITREMRAVARELGGERLSDCGELELLATAPVLRERYGERAVLRAAHFFEETRRAKAEAQALCRDDFPAFLELVRESAESSERKLQNITTPNEPQELLKSAILAARELLAGAGAVRVHGGGFAGTAQAWVPEDMAEDLIAGMGARGFRSYRARVRPVGALQIL